MYGYVVVYMGRYGFVFTFYLHLLHFLMYFPPQKKTNFYICLCISTYFDLIKLALNNLNKLHFLHLSEFPCCEIP